MTCRLMREVEKPGAKGGTGGTGGGEGGGAPRTFLEVSGAGDHETVVFAWAVFPSREQRDEANAKIMQDPRIGVMLKTAKDLFDCTRMAFGGFRPLVHT